MAKKQIEVKPDVSVRDAGRRGGEATRDRHGESGFYQKIGAMGGKRMKKLLELGKEQEAQDESDAGSSR